MSVNRKKILTAGGAFVAVGVLVFVIVRGATARGSDVDPTELIPERKLKEIRPGRPASVQASAQGTDLLDLIEAPKDAVAGVWGFQDRALITSGVAWGRLQVPCLPPEEYDLALRVTRKRGVSSFHVGLVQDGHQGMIVFDGEDGRTSWISLSTGSETDNETLTPGKVLKWNRETRLVISVRKDRIAVAADGKPVLEWKGNGSRHAFPAGWNVPQAKALFLGSSDSVFRIDEATLIPVAGAARLLR
jgi:hypothetical protein